MMGFPERLSRAELARCWREYRETRALPIAHEFAAKSVSNAIQIVRVHASRRGASRPPEWN